MSKGQQQEKRRKEKRKKNRKKEKEMHTSSSSIEFFDSIVFREVVYDEREKEMKKCRILQR